MTPKPSAALKISFFLALFGLLFGTVFFPSIRFFSFSPFLALFFQKKDFHKSLWAGAFTGLILDLTSSHIRFGLFTLCGLFTAFISHRGRKWFSEYSLFTIPFYTVVISIIFTLIQGILISHYFHPVSLITPLIDGLYGFIWFTCPLYLYNKISSWRKGYP